MSLIDTLLSLVMNHMKQPIFVFTLRGLWSELHLNMVCKNHFYLIAKICHEIKYINTYCKGC